MRIRSIKPEFWRSEDITVLDWETRLLFIGLWSYVDDNGVGIDRKASIAADLFAQDLEDDAPDTFARVSRGLQTLSDKGRITRYKVAGKRFLHITNWDKHQRIDKPNKPRYPLPTCEDAEIRESSATHSRDTRETPAPGTEEQGNRGTGLSCAPAAADDAREVAPDCFDEFWDAYDKKIGRKKAEQKYRLALKKPGITAELLVTAAGAYVDRQRAVGKHPEFTKDAATWINGEHWADEAPAAPTGGFPVNGTEAEQDAWIKAQPLPTDGAYYGGSAR